MLPTKNTTLRRICATDAPQEVFLIRLLVGAVFLSEGVQKFLFPAALGVGRFAKIGIPAPEFFGPFMGVVEIVGGVLLMAGLLTRPAALFLLVNMMVAISTTKIPILVKEGFWKMAHESRTDWSMLLGALFLLLVGAGAWSLDARIAGISPKKNPDPKPTGRAPGAFKPPSISR